MSTAVTLATEAAVAIAASDGNASKHLRPEVACDMVAVAVSTLAAIQSTGSHSASVKVPRAA